MFEQFIKPKKKFNRHDKNSYQLLPRIRHDGKNRLNNYNQGIINFSSCLKLLFFAPQRYSVIKKDGIFIDCGCGESPDRNIMKDSFGFQTFGIDLFPVNNHPEEVKISDICEKEIWQTVSNANIISCNAMIALIEPQDRILFYKNVYDNLKLGGIFVINFIKLDLGYSLGKGRQDIDEIEKIGFSMRAYNYQSILFIKYNN